jgi:hypothetical protein
MKKITKSQQTALNQLGFLNKPSTSQEIGVQIITMQALQRAGRVKSIDKFGTDDTFGRECETIRWELVKPQA